MVRRTITTVAEKLRFISFFYTDSNLFLINAGNTGNEYRIYFLSPFENSDFYLKSWLVRTLAVQLFNCRIIYRDISRTNAGPASEFIDRFSQDFSFDGKK